jgi:hypothetical protein
MRRAWFAHDSNWRRGPRNASAAPRACRLQPFVRPRRGAMHGARLERIATARASTEWLPPLALLRRTGCSVGARRFPRAPLCTFRLGAATGPESFPSCLASLHSSPPTNRVDRRGRRGLTPTSAADTLYKQGDRGAGDLMVWPLAASLVIRRREDAGCGTFHAPRLSSPSCSASATMMPSGPRM